MEYILIKFIYLKNFFYKLPSINFYLKRKSFLSKNMLKNKNLNFSFLFKTRNLFSIYNNHRHKAKYFIDYKEHKLDLNLQEYDLFIQEYLNRRWTRKEEIRKKRELY